MRKIVSALILILSTLIVFSQSGTDELISSAGRLDSAGDISVNWSLGELIIGYKSNGQTNLNLGFQRATQLDIPEVDRSDLFVMFAESQDNYFNGDDIEISIEVANKGKLDATGSFGSLFLSEDMFIDSFDIELGLFVIGSIDSDKSLSIDIPFFIHDSIEVGDYYLIVDVDILDNLTESDEFNNMAQRAFRIGDLSLAPDLEITAGEIPSMYLIGEALDISIDIRNNGQTEAKSSELVYYLSDNADLSGDYDVLGSSQVDRIQSGEQISVQKTFVLVDTTYAGNRQLIIVADGYYQLGESVESNNQLVHSLEILNNEDQTTSIDVLSQRQISVSPNPVSTGFTV